MKKFGVGTASLMALGALAIGVQIRPVNFGQFSKKRMVDEKQPLLFSKGVSAGDLSKQKFAGLLNGVWIPQAEFSKPLDMGEFVFESTAAVVMRSERLRSTGGNSKFNFNAAVTVPYGVISTGQRTEPPYTHSMEFRGVPLVEGGTMTPTAIPLPENPDKTPKYLAEPGTDNQIVKAKDGSLYAFRNTTYWGPGSVKPVWWDKHNIQGHPYGSRVGTMVWKSADGSNWKQVGFIDPLKPETSRYSVPRPVPQEPGGCPNGCFGGFDRMEAYACPYTGALYATMSAHGGWRYDYSKTPPTTKDTQLASTNYLYKSIDGGANWKMVYEFGAWTPIVMTSTPSGRLYLYSNVDVKPKIAYTTVNNDSSVTMSQWYEVGLPDIPVGGDELYGDRVYKACNTISRVSVDKSTNVVRISYPFVNAKGKSAVAIATVTTAVADSQPSVAAHSVIQAGADRSVLCSAFVDGDPVIAQSGTQIAAFFWIEGTGTKKTEDGEAVVKCRVFRGLTETSADATLSAKHSPNLSAGHYMGGGAYAEAGKAKFFLQWPERPTQKAQVISVSMK